MRIDRSWQGWGRRAAFAVCLATCVVAGAAPRGPRRRTRAAAKPPARTAIQDAPALAPFFEGLARLEAPRPARPGQPPVVRVLQFGDSHTAADFWPGRVRERLQARFGDGGPGLIQSGRPWRGYPHPGVSLLAGLKWPAESLRSRAGDGLVGLAGASLAPVSGEAFRLRATFATYRVQVLETGPEPVTATLAGLPGNGPAPGSEAGPATVPETGPAAGSEPGPGPESVPPVRTTLPKLSEAEVRDGVRLVVYGEDGLPAESPRELDLWLPDSARLLGIDLQSGRPGVVYDELGLNGAEILDLERWDPRLRQFLLAQARPGLLVLAYGTNDMGLSAATLADYPGSVRRLLQDLRTVSGAPILVVGPLDRLGRGRDQRPGLRAGAAYIIESLRQASAAAGCAFWDARQAMGGYGALLRWRRAGLAQPDLVHLNGGGYQKLGDLMADALLAAYDQYRHPAPHAVQPPVPRRRPGPPAPPARHRKPARRPRKA